MAELLYAEVTGSANGVVTSLERLQTTLGTLQGRFATATTAAGGFANAILGIKAPASAAGLSSLSRSISSIANASLKLQASAPQLAGALSSVSLAVNNMPAVNPESVASITAMGTAFKGLGTSLRNITKYAESAGIALLGLVNAANGLPALNASATKTLSLLKDIAPTAARGSAAIAKMGVASEGMGKQAYAGGNGLFHLLSMAKRYVITGIVIHMISSISQAISSALSNSAAWIEDMNYFNVAYGEMAVKAGEYYTTISEALGIDMSYFIKNGAMFEQMAKSLGLSSDAAYSLSTNLMAIGIDLASLTGKDLQDTWDALQSGVIAGQYKPLAKGYGINVTQSSLGQTILSENASMKQAQAALDDYSTNGLADATIAQTALNEGITESVRNMDPMEKAYLRYKTVLNAARLAQGDMAKTLESPANQTRVFQSAVMGLSRAFGNVMIPILIRVIPYVIAFVRLLGDAFNGLAKFFGFKPVDFANTVSLAPIAADLGGVGNAADDASGAVSELKKNIMGFDQFNILTSNKSSGAGAGGAGGGSSWLDGVDWGDYDLQLEKLVGGKTEAAMKAISDALAPLSASFGKLWDSLQPLIGQLKIFWDTILVPIGNWVLGTGLPGLVDFTTTLFKWFNNNPETTKTIMGFALAMIGLSKISQITIGIKATLTDLGLLAPVLTGAGGATIAAGTLTIGATLAIAAASIGVAYIVGSLVVGAVNAEIKKEPITEQQQMLTAGQTGQGGQVYTNKMGQDLGQFNYFKALGDTSLYMAGANSSLPLWKQAEQENLKRLESSFNYVQAAKDSWTFNILGQQTENGKKILAEMTANALKGVSDSFNPLAIPQAAGSNNAPIADPSGVKTASLTLPTAGAAKYSAAVAAIAIQTRKSNQANVIYSNGFKGVDSAVIDTSSNIEGLEDSATSSSKGVKGAINNIFKPAIAAAKSFTESGTSSIVGSFAGVPSSVLPHVNALNGVVSTGASATANSLTNGISNGVNSTVGIFGGLMGSTKPALDSFGNGVSAASTSAGRSLIDGSDLGRRGAIGAYQSFSNQVTEVFETLDANIKRIMTHVVQMMAWMPQNLSPKEIWAATSGLAMSKVTGLQMYANGGFPEDGLFMANHGEMVGKFSNGRTAVANNVQIVEGIKYGVASGVVSAIKSVGTNSGSGEYNVGMYKAVRDALKEMKFEATPVVLEGQQIGEVAIRVINKKTSTSGLSPLKA